MAVNGRYRWAAEDAIAPLAALFCRPPGRLVEATEAREPSIKTPPSGEARQLAAPLLKSEFGEKAKRSGRPAGRPVITEW